MYVCYVMELFENHTLQMKYYEIMEKLYTIEMWAQLKQEIQKIGDRSQTTTLALSFIFSLAFVLFIIDIIYVLDKIESIPGRFEREMNALEP